MIPFDRFSRISSAVRKRGDLPHYQLKISLKTLEMNEKEIRISLSAVWWGSMKESKEVGFTRFQLLPACQVLLVFSPSQFNPIFIRK